MANTLDANLNIISGNDAIKVEILDGDLSFISKLDDEPNDVGGMTSAELKAEFDKAGNVIKTYINEKLIPAILEDDATEIARTAAEHERATNEISRVEAEALRNEAEEARHTAEAARVLAEDSRRTAETSRSEAEEARVQAELQRVDSTQGIVARATQKADDAAACALRASESETSAGQSASDAAVSKAAALVSQNAAALSEARAANSETAARSWAEGGTGTRTGEDTANAKYWAGRAETFAGGGVTTFNGRKGDVKPQGGDYSYYLTFSTGDWSEENTIEIPASVHGLTGNAVSAQAMCLKNGAYHGNTWVGLCTWASISEDGTITIHSPDGPYDGAVLIIC